MVIGAVGITSIGLLSGLLIFLSNWLYFFNKFEYHLADIPTTSFFGNISSIFAMIQVRNKVVILIEFVILIFMTLFIINFSKKEKNKPVIDKAIFSKDFRNNESRTDLDMLYRLLIRKKELSLRDIEQLFKVNNDVALDWCKVLENAELALIDYPNFQKPVLRLPEVEKEIKVLGKNQTTKVITDTITGKKRVVVVDKVVDKPSIAKKPVEKPKNKVKIVARTTTKRKSTPIVRKKSAPKKTSTIKVKPKKSTSVKGKVKNKKVKNKK